MAVPTLPANLFKWLEIPKHDLIDVVQIGLYTRPSYDNDIKDRCASDVKVWEKHMTTQHLDCIKATAILWKDTTGLKETYLDIILEGY